MELIAGYELALEEELRRLNHAAAAVIAARAVDICAGWLESECDPHVDAQLWMIQSAIFFVQHAPDTVDDLERVIYSVMKSEFTYEFRRDIKIVLASVRRMCEDEK